MSSLPPSSRYLQQPDEPISDDERESLTGRLADSYTEGRLGESDYFAALDQLYRAKTLGDLVPIIEQLPAASIQTPATIRPGQLPAGQTSSGRNMVVPALVGVGALAGLAILAAIIFGVMFF